MRAIACFAFGICRRRVRRAASIAFSVFDGLVVAAQRVVGQGFVIAQLRVVGDQRLGLLQRGERLFVVALAALNVRRTDQRLGILRIALDQVFVDLVRLLRPCLGDERIGQTALCVRVVRVLVERAL